MKNDTVYKYSIPFDPQEGVYLPKDAEVLFCDAQGPASGFYVWALIDPYEGDLESRFIFTVGTGHPLPHDWKVRHINSVQHEPFVWHFFERIT